MILKQNVVQINMTRILWSCFICVLILEFCQSERRIKDGQKVNTNKSYMVYLTKAPKSPQKYDNWICGGVLVTSWYVISSAACVEDVLHVYVIAGYDKYVKPSELDNDRCTKNKKKRVVYTCVPKSYDLDYSKIEKWSHIDIAVLKMESRINLDDESYKKYCSYIPTFIPINYEPNFQKPGVDAIVLGWGHLKKWREKKDHNDYNQEMLHYAPARIYDKNKCKEHYGEEMEQIIDKYMICTYAAGNLDDKGEVITKTKPLADGCVYEKVLLDGVEYLECVNNEETVTAGSAESRRKFNNMTLLANQTFGTRRNGICQNDHGGPLVTWVGSREVLIGVASVFRVTDNMECEGPYLFTSTQCNGVFLDCVINRQYGRRQCNLPPRERGFDMVERRISWIDHPDGPAENERIDKVRLRPQVPINRYN